MRHFSPTVLAVIVALIASRGILSAAEELKSGPQPGELIPGPFHYLNVNGAHAGNPHCLVCEFGLRPVVLVFARESPSDKSPLAVLLQKLDEAVERYKNAELRAGVVVLNDDFAKGETRKDLVRKLETSAKDLKHVVVAVDSSAGPKEYAINKDAEVTVVLYNEHKVVANFAFAKDKLTEKDATAILSAVNKMIGSK
jgi:sulfur carrier protein ThiS